MGLLRGGHVHGDEVRKGEDVIEVLHQLDLKGAGATLGEVGIVSEDAHAERHGAAGDLRADAAHAEDGEAFVVELGAFEAFAVPLAGPDRGMGLGDFSR